MSESFEPIDQTHNKNTKSNTWEPAIWAFICGATTLATIDTLTISDLAPKWLKIVTVLTTAGLAAGSAYKAYKSVKHINNQKQR